MEKTFAISYKLGYAETSDWGTEYLKANNKEDNKKAWQRKNYSP